MKKNKVLFVVMDFWQAGAERFAYEVHSCLNNQFFEVTILSIRDLHSSKDFEDYYYTRHLSLNSKVFFLSDIISAKTIFSKIKNRVPNGIKKKVWKNEDLASFFNQFEVINWFGEYTFSSLVDRIDTSVYNKSIIHIMTAKFQGNTFYENFPKDKGYLFTSGFDDEEQLKFEFSDFLHYKHILFPLYLNVSNKINNWTFNTGNKNKKIGIFTRLSTMKPLDPFLYAFHLISDIIPGVELHLFGSGNPVTAGIQKYIDHLGVSNRVFYRGHQENIVDTALNEKLDLVWFQGYKNRPAGYAGYDICSAGIPQIFWDFTNSKIMKPDSHAVYPIYNNLKQFVERSIDLLTNENEAHRLSNLQFNDVVQNRDMKLKVQILEKAFLEIAARTDNTPDKVKSY